MKNLIRILFFSPVLGQEKPVDILLEGLAQRHCNYCPSLKRCVEPETYCKEFDFPYNILYNATGIIIPDNNNGDIFMDS
tara:strand:+ start:3218 stop:3454 length:237 start_codon:yes stop_codon:yes gene_type:complete